MNSFKLSKLKDFKNWDIFRIKIRALLAEKGYIDAIKPKREFSENTAKKRPEVYQPRRNSLDLLISQNALLRVRGIKDEKPIVKRDIRPDDKGKPKRNESYRPESL
jgi:hypothetical protein